VTCSLRQRIVVTGSLVIPAILKSSMIRVALILQVIIGLIVGPNGCCCAGHRIGGLFLRAVPPTIDSCCDAIDDEHAVASCCSHCTVVSEKETSNPHARTPVAYRSCCQKTESCLCVASIRPSIHRVQIDTELSLLTDYTKIVVWRVTELEREIASAIASARLSSSMSLRAFDQPGRACAILYQRWNC